MKVLLLPSAVIGFACPTAMKANGVVIRHPGAACVLAETEDGKVVLVRQWRYAADQATLELPAGKLDVADEDPAECALRELAEETPYVADSVKLLYSFLYCSRFLR